MKSISVILAVLLLFVFQSDYLPGNKKEIWKAQTDYALRLYKEGKYREALKIEESALKTAEQTFGKEHANYTSNLNNIGEIYRILKDLDLAEKYFKMAVSIELGRKSRINQTAALRYISNLALLYESVKKYEDAEKYQKLALSYAEEIFGKKSSEKAEALSRLGRIYRKLERFNEAGDVLKQALDINLGLGNVRNKNNIFIYSNLGMNFEESGDFDKSVYFMKKAVSLSKDVYGDNSPETARNINNLSTLYFKFSKFKEAKDLTEKFIKINRQQSVRDDRMISTGMSNLAAVYYAQNIYTGAEKIFLDLLRGQEKRLGKGHIATAATLRKLGILYFSWKKYSKCREFLERSFDIGEIPETPDDVGFYEGKTTLGLAYEKLGLYEKALMLYKGALDLKIKFFGENSSKLLPAINDLGIYYFRTGIELFSLPMKNSGTGFLIESISAFTALSCLGESGVLFKKGKEIADRFPEQTFPASLTTVNYYMEYLLITGRHETAEILYTQIVSRYRRIFGASHLNMTNILRQLARFYRQTGQMEKALNVSRDVVSIYNKNGLGSDLSIAESLRELGNILIECKEFKEALEVFMRKLNIFEKKYGPDSLELANDVYEVGEVYRLQNNGKMAGKYYQRVIEIWDSGNQDGGIDYIPFLKDISDKLLQTGNKRQWRKLNTRIREILRKEAKKKELNR